MLGSLLFLRYVNDRLDVVFRCKMQIFAEDTFVNETGFFKNEVTIFLNEEVKNTHNWLYRGNIIVNFINSKAMYLGTHRYSVGGTNLCCFKELYKRTGVGM